MAEQGTDYKKTEDAAVAEAETIRQEDATRHFDRNDYSFPEKMDEDFTCTVKKFLNLTRHRPWVVHERPELHFFLEYLQTVKAEFPSAGKNVFLN